MKYILLLLALTALIIESSIRYAHPYRLTVPTDYFEQPELSIFLLVTFLTFGVGQVIIPLMLHREELSLRTILLILLIGLSDKWLLSSDGYILALGTGLLLAHFIRKSWAGYLLFAVGIFLIAVPLLILYFPAETFMAAAHFQEVVTLYQSNDYMSYIQTGLTSGYIWIMATALFIVLPLLLIDLNQVPYRYMTAIMLFSAGVILKTFVTHSESVLVFSLLMMLGGLLQGISLYLMLRGTAKFTVIPVLAFSSLLQLITFTGVGFGDYRNLSIDQVLLRAAVIVISVIIIYFVSSHKKHANY
ncbi:hypothetical protein [Macrococcus carouselicus]|uniref:Uncharacterized protein n=1 Tax=Macrococcus carouselicus TaxID=69969 RepID=A0A9Q8CMV4_9STAP|nr:hypothetical protein [Macrococcus carouselicus]TDM03777.1 hypothetical protein ERX40_01030 [Macrococcus carouselicus]